MGCGHSKINIYSRKSRAKAGNKKAVAPEKTDAEEEETVEQEAESNENLEDCDQRKTIKVKPFGQPLLVQAQISTSQQDFFKMLDEKIENGPDYNSECEAERIAEAARLCALLKDWETASAGSRSLPTTPRRRPGSRTTSDRSRHQDGTRSADTVAKDHRQAQGQTAVADRTYISQIPQSVIHQSYGVTQSAYKHPLTYATPTVYIPQPTPPNYPSALQYQALSPMYTSQPTYQPLPRQYPAYNQHGSPIRSYVPPSPQKYPPSPQKFPPAPQNFPNTPYDPGNHSYEQAAYSPGHRLYGPSVQPPKQMYSNGELYQYREPQGAYRGRGYVAVQGQGEVGNALHRKQYELT